MIVWFWLISILFRLRCVFVLIKEQGDWQSRFKKKQNHNEKLLLNSCAIIILSVFNSGRDGKVFTVFPVPSFVAFGGRP